MSANTPPLFKAPEAMAAMNAQGVEMAAESLRQHLRRLVKDERFGREGDFYVNPVAVEPEQPPAADNNGNGQAIQASSEADATATVEDREIGIDTAPHLG